MSSRLVGLVMEHYPACSPGEYTLAIALADEAAHSGGNIRAVVPEMARLSRQTEQSVRRLLRKMQASGWLQCLEASAGGRGKSSLYCINPEWVELPLGYFARKPEQPEQPEPNVRVSVQNLSNKPEPNVRVSTPHLSLQALPPLPPKSDQVHSEVAVPSAAVESDPLADKHLELARWMHGLLLSLNAKQREPNWRRWQRDIRVMVNAGHSHHDIGALFKWANGQRTPKPGSDFCWARVILSPAKLWKQWDALNVARQQLGPMQAARHSPLCQQCGKRDWAQQRGRLGLRLCSQCAEMAERAHA